MKKVIILVALLFSIDMLAQVPQGINYQSVVRGSNGNPLSNQSLTLQFNYVDKLDESIDFVESFSTSTDEFGVVNFVLGTGAEIANSFPELNWSKQYRIDIFVNLGNGFAILGSQDLVSVPYALNAAHAESVDLTLGELTDVNTVGAISGNVLMFDGAEWVPADANGGGSGFALPFLATDPNLVSFGVTNTSGLGGSAIYGQTTTNAANATGVKGQSTGASGRGVYGTATGVSAYGVLGENTNGTAIRGTTNGAGANGVHGVANSDTGVGVRGESNNGTGVLAYSGNGLAVNASSLSGDAIYASSSSGYALTTSGNVKIAGGNTNPGAGKVLTSDAQGNATWQATGATPKIAFRAQSPNVPIPDNATAKVEFSSEGYDFGNCFTPYAGSATSNSSTFVAPVNGVYHFNAIIQFQNTDDFFNFETDFTELSIISIDTNGNLKVVASNDALVTSNLSFDEFSSVVCGDVYITAGTKVFMETYQDNDQDQAQTPQPRSFFSGHLVFSN
jgi:hypothetical protein